MFYMYNNVHIICIYVYLYRNDSEIKKSSTSTSSSIDNSLLCNMELETYYFISNHNNKEFNDGNNNIKDNIDKNNDDNNNTNFDYIMTGNNENESQYNSDPFKSKNNINKTEEETTMPISMSMSQILYENIGIQMKDFNNKNTTSIVR